MGEDLLLELGLLSCAGVLVAVLRWLVPCYEAVLEVVGVDVELGVDGALREVPLDGLFEDEVLGLAQEHDLVGATSGSAMLCLTLFLVATAEELGVDQEREVEIDSEAAVAHGSHRFLEIFRPQREVLVLLGLPLQRGDGE